MVFRKIALGSLTGLMMLGTLIESSAYSQEGNLVYPSTKTVEQVDDFHGTKVEDPYRWLEDDVRENKDVAAWVAAQNEVTFGYLKSIPQREVIQKRMTELWNYEKIGAPFKRGGRYYVSRNDGLQNQNVLFRQETLESEPADRHCVRSSNAHRA